MKTISNTALNKAEEMASNLEIGASKLQIGKIYESRVNNTQPYKNSIVSPASKSSRPSLSPKPLKNDEHLGLGNNSKELFDRRVNSNG